mmetsp:Transcript_7208/g.13669  ORF Transcript_7208/g.13669 Transcript_7208/m.13669 type:complete len:95 (-) Transcript_7208:283-567(-)
MSDDRHVEHVFDPTLILNFNDLKSKLAKVLLAEEGHKASLESALAKAGTISDPLQQKLQKAGGIEAWIQKFHTATFTFSEGKVQLTSEGENKFS